MLGFSRTWDEFLERLYIIMNHYDLGGGKTLHKWILAIGQERTEKAMEPKNE